MTDTFDPTSIVYVLDDRGVASLKHAIADCREIVVDLETSGLSPYAPGARISLASFTLPRDNEPDPPTYALPLSHPEGPFVARWQDVARDVFEAVRRSRKPVTNQNVKFDVKWVHAHTGVDLSSALEWDTQVAAHLLDENASTKLKEVAPAAFAIERWDDVDLTRPGAADRVPFFDLAIYAARDTYWTWRLADKQRHELGLTPEGRDNLDPMLPEDRDALRLGRLAARLVIPTVRTLTAVEQRGFTLDVDDVVRRINDLSQTAETARSRLRDADPTLRTPDAIAGESYEATSLWFRAYTDRAVAARRLRVIETTRQGRPSWSKRALRHLARNGHEVAQDLLDLRHAVKRTQYLRSWLDYVGEDGKVHANYRVGSVITGRLSCTDPNMQQVSSDLKPCWVGSPGTYIVEVDYSQIELRAAAFVARCEPMLQAFREGRDLHRIMAAAVTSKPEHEVTSQERQRAKAINFGFLYGMGAAGFQTYAEDTYGVAFSEEEAEHARSAFFTTWDGLDRWHKQTVNNARLYGQVVSPLGRIRRLPTIHDGNDQTRGHAERQAMNSPIQSFASDLMQLAAARIEGTLPGEPGIPGVSIVATVHDSIVVEVPQDDWKRATARTIRAMLDLSDLLDPLDCALDVPLEVEAKVGRRWGDTFAVVTS